MTALFLNNLSQNALENEIGVIKAVKWLPREALIRNPGN
jgi:hypothetical protein